MALVVIDNPRPPERSFEFLLRAALTGSVASIAIAAALGWLARREGKRPLQPINATSHWLHGEQAGRVRRVDAAHTLVGYLTHHASAIFWAMFLEGLLGRGRRSPAMLLGSAAAVAGTAALVDYGMVPKRLTPGWELTVSKQAVAGAFVVMALALAAGAALARR
jgi:hypothetical protein